MSLIDRSRDSHADVVSALNISLWFAALIITLFIIIRVGNKIYNNKKTQQCWNWALRAVRHEGKFMQNCVISFPTRLEYFSFLCLSCSLHLLLCVQPLQVINHTAAMVLVWSLVSLLFLILTRFWGVSVMLFMLRNWRRFPSARSLWFSAKFVTRTKFLLVPKAFNYFSEVWK